MTSIETPTRKRRTLGLQPKRVSMVDEREAAVKFWTAEMNLCQTLDAMHHRDGRDVQVPLDKWLKEALFQRLDLEQKVRWCVFTFKTMLQIVTQDVSFKTCEGFIKPDRCSVTDGVTKWSFGETDHFLLHLSNAMMNVHSVKYAVWMWDFSSTILNLFPLSTVRKRRKCCSELLVL